MVCKICQTRRPRRYCPGVGGEICTVCCGTERENTVSCPLDCVYLQEARMHEKHPGIDPAQDPHRDIRVGDEFVSDNSQLIFSLVRATRDAGLGAGAIDDDVRDALESLIKTYRTLQSGLYYESRPTNPIAASIYENLQRAVAEFRKQSAETMAITTVRDADILGALVFVVRTGYQFNNGRRRGRAFLDFLRKSTGAEYSAPTPRSPLLTP